LLKTYYCVIIKLRIRDFLKLGNPIGKPKKVNRLIREPVSKKGSPQRVSLFGGFFLFLTLTF